jgi:hypothetical protein
MITPQTSTLYVFTDGKKSKWVPARKPAIKYPKLRAVLVFKD